VEQGSPIPEALLAATLVARDGRTTSFAELVAAGPTLVVFVRHFGCIGCAEQVHVLLPRLGELAALGVRVALVGCGPADHLDAFVERHDLADKSVEVLTDPTLAAFAAAGLLRSFWATWGPSAIADFLRAFAGGHRPGRPDGDLLQQGGAVLASGGRVAWAHRNESLGGHADPADIVDAALRLRLARSPLLV
jgi:peroxiredoxin